MIGRNYVLEKERRKTSLRKGLEYAGALGVLAGLGAGFYTSNLNARRESAAAQAFVEKSPRIEVTVPAEGIDKCYYAENISHSEDARNYFRKAAKERGSKLVMPDLDGDGYGCNERGEPVRKE